MNRSFAISAIKTGLVVGLTLSVIYWGNQAIKWNVHRLNQVILYCKDIRDAWEVAYAEFYGFKVMNSTHKTHNLWEKTPFFIFEAFGLCRNVSTLYMVTGEHQVRFKSKSEDDGYIDILPIKLPYDKNSYYLVEHHFPPPKTTSGFD